MNNIGHDRLFKELLTNFFQEFKQAKRKLETISLELEKQILKNTDISQLENALEYIFDFDNEEALLNARKGNLFFTIAFTISFCRFSRNLCYLLLYRGKNISKTPLSTVF